MNILNMWFNTVFCIWETFKRLDCFFLLKTWKLHYAFITKKQDHISSILASLHWIPVTTCFSNWLQNLISFKDLKGLIPSFISDLLMPYVAPHSLRSWDASLPAVVGDRAFAVRAPRLFKMAFYWFFKKRVRLPLWLLLKSDITFT